MGERFLKVQHREIFFPEALKKGDKIAIISPASAVKDEYVYDAMARLIEKGYEPVLMKSALGHEDGNFAASKSARLKDLFDALMEPEIKAILCARGGYGCCQLLDNLSSEIILQNPKWIIGFSDVSALHALWLSSGVASIHGPMAKHLATKPSDDPCTEALFNMLENGGRFDYTVPPHEYNRLGKVSGVIRGGNMSVLSDLAATPYDLLDNGRLQEDESVILFFEDIAEPIYKVNRMLWRLLLNGVLSKVKAIIFGQFTEYRPDKNFATMEEMIKNFIDKSGIPSHIPVVYNFPVGHTDLNFPVTEGALVELDVMASGVRLCTLF